MHEAELTSCVCNQFNGMYIVRAMNEGSRRKDFITIYIFIDCAVRELSPQRAFVTHYEQKNKNTKIKETFRCHYCDIFFWYLTKYKKHVAHCSGCLGFLYCFQDYNIESYKNYLKHKKKFPFTVVDDLETTTGYISEVEGGPMFAIPYCLMFNFHPKLNMRPITCLRSLGQTEKELKFITIFGNFWQYINKTDYRCSWMHVTLFFKKNKNKQIWPSVWLRYGWFIKPWKNILMVLLK